MKHPIPSQLRLAADIIENNLDWEFQTRVLSKPWVKGGKGGDLSPLSPCPASAVVDGYLIRVKKEASLSEKCQVCDQPEPFHIAGCTTRGETPLAN
jgi:hypothetical protein